ncbi:hypothetical protein [Saccharothrix sp. ST-888]|uniref:hypothetical protein n=1 Tax=Saccharothrix sp. ST-888 TaxID=1427391 RepID=UPI0005ECD031|nr:hypothetical protein [Saccharothrix sp. ST-888]KJK57158.1 hypothetical protein UK12_18100 [Saccharothrix sp. ST-888]
MVQLTGQFARPFQRAALAAGRTVRVPAVRRELDAAESGELLLSSGAGGGPLAIQWRRQGRPALILKPPYRLDRVELRGSHRARLYGLTAGVRLVCPDWSPLFLISPAQLPLLACAVAASRVARATRVAVRP